MSRILIVSSVDRSAVGGVATYVRNLEEELRRLGLSCKVLERSMSSRCRRSSNQYSLGFLFRRKEYFMSIAEQLLEVVMHEIEEGDLVHTQDPFTSLLIRRYFPTAVIVLTVHGMNSEHVLESISAAKGLKALFKRISGYNTSRLRRLKRLEKLGLSAADELIAVDSNYASRAIGAGNSSERIQIIHNSVPMDALQSLAERQPVYHPPVPYFLSARRLWPKNGVEYAVLAFLSWVGERNLNFVIAGDGPQMERISKHCSSSPYGHKVVLLGDVAFENIPSLMKRSIATIVPSVPVGGVIEATSFAALESLALGVPVIASDIGGLAEIDGGKQIMHLVPPADVASIAKAMERAYLEYISGSFDPSILRRHISDNFSSDVWVRKIAYVYNRDLGA